MTKCVLITGGAGFIGSHVADEMLRAGWRVRALDDLSEQVHGPGRRRPGYLSGDIELRVGDIRDRSAVEQAVSGVDAVIHLAAAVGVGQSMYEIERYTSVNAVGTAVLLEALARRDVQRLVVASSMSVYGEGRYTDAGGAIRDRVERAREQLEARVWEPLDPDGQPLRPLPTPEDKALALASVYALTKFEQEQACLIAGAAHRRPTVALRLFNTYGPRQALSNPYTGVLANFAARLLNGRAPLVFEDGLQRRDFVDVRDVARAFRAAIEAPGVDQEILNIGSGAPRTVYEVARLEARLLGRDLAPEVTGRYRMGDIRHCTGDVSRAARVLGWRARIPLEEGLAELGRWLAGQRAEDRSDQMRAELERRGMTL